MGLAVRGRYGKCTGTVLELSSFGGPHDRDHSVLASFWSLLCVETTLNSNPKPCMGAGSTYPKP